MSAALHNAETDAMITLEVWEATWEYRKRHRSTFDRHCCANVDAVEYMRKIRGHLDDGGTVVTSSAGLRQNMMMYKTHLAM